MRQFCRWSAALVAVLSLSGVTSVTEAQVPADRFNTQTFAPAPGPSNYLQVEGANVVGNNAFGAGLTLDYASRTFVLYNAECTDATETNCSVSDVNTELVSYIAQANLYASFVFANRFQVGLNIPLLLSNGDGFDRFIQGEAVQVPGGTQFAVGDPMLSLKARLYGEGEGFFLGATIFGTAPVAQQMGEGFLGDESLRVGGHLIAQFVQNGFHLSVNLGGFYRPTRTFLSTQIGSQLTYRAAVGYEVTPLVMLFAEIDGAAGLSSELDEHALEARLAARLRTGDFTFTLAGGAGLISGVGVPGFRAIGGFAYAPNSGDRDGDGVLDEDDACPTEAEDRDDWEDSDGCPEADNDRDGILDGDDPCPIEAEDADGFEDEDGCPDTDNDGDGVRDGFDTCPNDAEDMDGDRDEDGCPDNDTDRDGIDDVDDRCPGEPEDADGFGDDDGCPEADFDGDGIDDDMDECPDQAETANGVDDTDGCPEEDTDGDGITDTQDRCPTEAETLNGVRDDDGCPDGDPLIRRDGNRVMLLRQIVFANARARIRGERSQNILNAVATLLHANPQFTHVRVEGHTDNQGADATNLRLSQQRAEAVVRELVERGIDQARLQPEGLGSTRPLESNSSEEGRAANRRVEFHIDGGPESTPEPAPDAPAAAE